VVVCEQCFTAAQSNGDGKRHAVVSGNTVRRVKEDGSYDRMTVHLTSISARRAAELYVRTGEVKGMRP
jgi:hypothetical protein